MVTEFDLSCTRISKSPIWDPVTGFGGDGVPGTYTVPPDPANTSKILPDSFYHGCVKDGPFANYTLKLGPGLLVTEHCITRGVDDTFSVYLNSSAVAYTLSFPTFEQFRVKLEGMPAPPTLDHMAVVISLLAET
jgi:tyrosinase